MFQNALAANLVTADVQRLGGMDGSASVSRFRVSAENVVFLQKSVYLYSYMNFKDIRYPFYLLGLICLLAGLAFIFHAVKYASILSWVAAVVCAGGAYFALKTARLW